MPGITPGGGVGGLLATKPSGPSSGGVVGTKVSGPTGASVGAALAKASSVTALSIASIADWDVLSKASCTGMASAVGAALAKASTLTSVGMASTGVPSGALLSGIAPEGFSAEPAGGLSPDSNESIRLCDNPLFSSTILFTSCQRCLFQNLMNLIAS